MSTFTSFFHYFFKKKMWLYIKFKGISMQHAKTFKLLIVNLVYSHL